MITAITIDESYQTQFYKLEIDSIPGCRQFVVNKLKSELLEKERKAPQTEKYLSLILFESKALDTNPEIWKLVLDGNDFAKNLRLKKLLHEDFEQILRNQE